MEQYFESRYINEIACNDIMVDIAGMAIESQQRNQPFIEVIGGDFENFCKEMIENAPRQSWAERILSVMHWILLFSMVFVPGLFIIKMLIPKYAPGEINNISYEVPLAFLLKYFILMLIVVVGWFFVRMYTYKPMKYVMGSYVGIILGLFLASDFLLKYIIGDFLVYLNLIIWIIALALMLLMCDLSRKLVATTIAYKNSKKNK